MQTQNTNNKEEQLWKIAEKRAKFKRHAVSYFAVNAMFTAIWFVTSMQSGTLHYFWPIWCMLGWGIGLFFSFIDAYSGKNFFSADIEYEKLKKQQQKL